MLACFFLYLFVLIMRIDTYFQVHLRYKYNKFYCHIAQISLYID